MLSGMSLIEMNGNLIVRIVHRLALADSFASLWWSQFFNYSLMTRLIEKNNTQFQQKINKKIFVAHKLTRLVPSRD